MSAQRLQRSTRETFALGLTMVLVACGGTGPNPGTSDGGGGEGSDGGTAMSAIPLQFNVGGDEYAFVDTQGPYSNIQHIRMAAFRGSPNPATGYSWMVALGAGLPTTILVDSHTGLLEGTLSTTFRPGPPGVADGAFTIYPLTVTVSDGVSSVSSASGEIRLFISLCNSTLTAPYKCGQDGVGATPYPQGPPRLGLGYNDLQGTAAAPLDIVSDMHVTGIPVNRMFGYALSFSGGAPPYTFQLSSGALPPGLLLNPNGEILGTPAVAAVGNSYSFAVTITDGGGNASQYHFVLGGFKA